eukprot:2509615-Pyramimonas_sp.AAC.1
MVAERVYRLRLMLVAGLALAMAAIFRSCAPAPHKSSSTSERSPPPESLTLPFSLFPFRGRHAA